VNVTETLCVPTARTAHRRRDLGHVDNDGRLNRAHVGAVVRGEGRVLGLTVADTQDSASRTGERPRAGYADRLVSLTQSGGAAELRITQCRAVGEIHRMDRHVRRRPAHVDRHQGIGNSIIPCVARLELDGFGVLSDREHVIGVAGKNDDSIDVDRLTVHRITGRADERFVVKVGAIDDT